MGSEKRSEHANDDRGIKEICSKTYVNNKCVDPFGLQPKFREKFKLNTNSLCLHSMISAFFLKNDHVTKPYSSPQKHVKLIVPSHFHGSPFDIHPLTEQL